MAGVPAEDEVQQNAGNENQDETSSVQQKVKVALKLTTQPQNTFTHVNKDESKVKWE